MPAAGWTKSKTVKVGAAGQPVTVSCAGATDARGMTRVLCSCTVGSITYSEEWLLPHDNAEYTQAQAQIDFDAHVEKVALLTFARANSQALLGGLT